MYRWRFSAHQSPKIMSQKMLVTNFTFSVSRDELKAMAGQLAPAFAAVTGCLWKIWLVAEDKNEAGAVYLFADDAALQAFKASPLVASVLAHPALGNFELRERSINAEASAITRAPL
jgi:quinol monooxygenase YgiN